MFRSLSTAAIFICLSIPSFAQMMGAAVLGNVIDKAGTPVAFANVYIIENSWGTASDHAGSFALTGLEPGVYHIQVSALGYGVTSREVVVIDKESQILEFVLADANYTMPQVEVLGIRNRAMKTLPGSAVKIDKRELELLAPVSGNEVFRRVPGVHVVDEEGAGLRANIGIRGLDPDRSRTVLILEDGIPVALNPYGEPEMYYTPSIDRMAGVEVIKGAGQIAYGPRTIGGVINYITADPPDEEEVKLRVQGGQGGYFSGMMSYGNTYGNTGVQVGYLRRQADDLAGTRFNVNDFTAKFRLELSEKASLGLKVGLYNETSNSTYIGLTQPMYNAGGNDFVRMAPDDKLDVNRSSMSATHLIKFNPQLELRTTAYGYLTSRNWRRQDFNYTGTGSNLTGVVWGDTSVVGGAVYMRSSTGNRDRAFAVAGIESKAVYRYQAGIKNELQAGARLHYENALEQRINGTKPDAESGTLVEDEERTGNAQSLFLENKSWITEKLVVTAGLRLENYNYDRQIFRMNYNGVVTDTNLVAGSTVSKLLPALGLTYGISPDVQLFGGVHRGFAPPRVKDAITAQGQAYQLDAELSWNFELGTRATIIPGFQVEATAFMLDFSNQIIPVSESSGGTGAGEINGGSTMHQGAELGIVAGVGRFLEAPFRLDVDVNATYINAYFSEDRFIGGEDSGENISGNRTPYAPEFLLSSGITFETLSGLGLRLTGTYVSEQFTDELNTLQPTADGRTGLIPSYFVLDGTARYAVKKWNTTFTLSCKNISDERYMASRRPQGIRVGLPRLITAGLSIQF